MTDSDNASGDKADSSDPLESAASNADAIAGDDLETRYEPSQESRPPPPPALSARNELPFGLVFFLLLALGVVVFAVQNTQDVELRYLGWTGEYPLAVVIVAVIMISVVLDEILGLILRRRKRRRLAERQELEQLRQMNS